MSKRCRWYVLSGILLAALLAIFVWMRLPQSFHKVIGVAENSVLYVYTGDAEDESRSSPPEPAYLEPLPAVLEDSTLRPWGFRRVIDTQPGESTFFFTIHAFSPEGEWLGAIPVALRGGDMLYKPHGEDGYLWYGMDCDQREADQELRRVLDINW